MALPAYGLTKTVSPACGLVGLLQSFVQKVVPPVNFGPSDLAGVYGTPSYGRPGYYDAQRGSDPACLPNVLYLTVTYGAVTGYTDAQGRDLNSAGTVLGVSAGPFGGQGEQGDPYGLSPGHPYRFVKSGVGVYARAVWQWDGVGPVYGISAARVPASPAAFEPFDNYSGPAVTSWALPAGPWPAPFFAGWSAGMALQSTATEMGLFGGLNPYTNRCGRRGGPDNSDSYYQTDAVVRFSTMYNGYGAFYNSCSTNGVFRFQGKHTTTDGNRFTANSYIVPDFNTYYRNRPGTAVPYPSAFVTPVYHRSDRPFLASGTSVSLYDQLLLANGGGDQHMIKKGPDPETITLTVTA